MEALFIYLLKSSALIALFYLAYHFLVRKETFFNSNRWFLLSGLLTSVVLPFYIIKKIILIERPKISPEELEFYSQQSVAKLKDVPVVEAFDWMQLFWVSYIIIACVLMFKIILNFTSLYRMLYQQQIIKKEQFKLVNLNENIAPFSFFNYIVYNSDLYSDEELQSILLHEKIHSKEKHSLDILLAKLFCIVFWFNPFVWLYKKAISQNLEYIADQKAIEHLEDKKSYQRALLKVVSNQSCLSITNNFYQSLIKKRIVMLNKNQSHKRNLIKYAFILPALIGFIFLFQVKIIAQEREETMASNRTQSDNEVRVVVNKNTSDAEMKNDIAVLKKNYGITLKYSKVKRNSS
jgi:Zn-dependent protease with chaperone function